MSGNRPIGRRGLLGTMAAAGVAGFVPGRPARAQQAGAWEAWKARFLAPDGRVIDQLQDREGLAPDGIGLVVLDEFHERPRPQWSHAGHSLSPPPLPPAAEVWAR